jgi:hypothetical protein
MSAIAYILITIIIFGLLIGLVTLLGMLFEL